MIPLEKILTISGQKWSIVEEDLAVVQGTRLLNGDLYLRKNVSLSLVWNVRFGKSYYLSSLKVKW